DVGYGLEEPERSDAVGSPAVLQAGDEAALGPQREHHEHRDQPQGRQGADSGIDDGDDPAWDADADQPVVDGLADGQPKVGLAAPLADAHSAPRAGPSPLTTPVIGPPRP